MHPLEKQILEDIERIALDVLTDAALEIEGGVKTEMQKPKHGRLYKRSDGSLHRASAPDEAPAVDKGKYIGSIETVVSGSIVGGETLSATVGTDVTPYPAIHEESGREVWKPVSERVVKNIFQRNRERNRNR